MTDTVADWLALVDRRHPESTAQSWDHVGLQVGAPDDPVERVVVALDVTSAVVAEAARGPRTLVLAHHPLLFQPLVALTPATATGRIALAAARAGVAVAAAHTNLDVATDGAGTSDPVVRALDLVDVEPLTAATESVDEVELLGRRGRLPEPMSLGAVAARLRDRLPAPDLRLAGDPARVVETVAVVGGAGDSMVDVAVAARVDVYVTGDLRHHVVLDALEQGLALVDAGHHAVEVAALPPWVELLRADARDRSLTATVVASAVSTRPWSDLPD